MIHYYTYKQTYMGTMSNNTHLWKFSIGEDIFGNGTRYGPLKDTYYLPQQEDIDNVNNIIAMF